MAEWTDLEYGNTPGAPADSLFQSELTSGEKTSPDSAPRPKPTQDSLPRDSIPQQVQDSDSLLSQELYPNLEPTPDLKTAWERESEMGRDSMAGLERGPEGKSEREARTCSELYDQIKKSDCAKPYFRFLKGASVKVGGSLNFSNLQIMSGDTLQASLNGLLTPSPYYSLSLASSFFGSTRFGYEFSLTYNSSVALNQSIRRGETTRRFDLHTYSTISIAAITPSVYFSIGGRDEDPKTFFRLGLGLGAGWASVRGTAYFTENDQNTLCYDEGSLLLEDGSSREEVRERCGLVSYKKSGLGGSARVFLDWRRHWLYGSFEVVELRLTTSQYEFKPADGLIKLAYILDI